MVSSRQINGYDLKTTLAFGASQFIFNSWPAQILEVSYGSAISPVSTVGPLLKLSRTESMDKALANGNAVDNEANATLAVYAVGTSTSNMQTNAAFFGAKGAPGTADVVGVVSIGVVNASGTGIGTGAYIEGRRENSNGKVLGAEIRSTNNGAAISFATGDFDQGGLWITAAGVANSGAGVALGTVNGRAFDVGYGAVAGSVASQTFRDESSSVTSVQINGTHTYGVDLTGGSFSGAPIAAPLGAPASSSAQGKQGSVLWDANYIYICTAANTWKRAALSAF